MRPYVPVDLKRAWVDAKEERLILDCRVPGEPDRKLGLGLEDILLLIGALSEVVAEVKRSDPRSERTRMIERFVRNMAMHGGEYTDPFIKRD